MRQTLVTLCLLLLLLVLALDGRLQLFASCLLLVAMLLHRADLVDQSS